MSDNSQCSSLCHPNERRCAITADGRCDVTHCDPPHGSASEAAKRLRVHALAFSDGGDGDSPYLPHGREGKPSLHRDILTVLEAAGL